MIGAIQQRKRSFPPSISKEEINKLPLVQYEGPTQLVRSQEELKKALSILGREKLLGFDTETRPSFRKTDTYLPALLQLCTAKEAFLIQLPKIQDYSGIAALFANTSQQKVGVAIRDDLAGLMKIFPFSPERFIDLADLARLAEINNTGLRSLCGITMGKRISKSAQVSNWAKDELTPKQIVYAATDAWVSREIFLVFQKSGLVKKHIRKLQQGVPLSKPLKRKIERLGLETITHHIFICTGSDSSNCCSEERGQEAFKYLHKRLKELQLIDGKVLLSKVHSLEINQKGPLILIYPEGTWYHSCTPEVIERIIQNHILNGKVVKENLLLINKLK
ncbi:MAG: hypothetical protein MI748_17140 [Opitutales bacterium]|nr:hypothetical protein [Opitutales bacterium]